MVAHQTIGMADPAKPRDGVAENCEKRLPVGIIHEDMLPRIAARSDVVKRAGKFDSQGPCHNELNTTPPNAIKQDLTPTYATYGYI